MQDSDLIDIQIASSEENLPSVEQFENWIDSIFNHLAIAKLSVAIRVVDEEEMEALNESFRQRQGVTNVLSFPFEKVEGVPWDHLGDIAICASVVAKEAEVQSKSLISHWAHITIHGMLHLCGYDHVVDQDADKMEALEVSILSTLGYSNPYQ